MVEDPSFPVKWKLTREGAQLVLRYEVENRSSEDAWLLDVPHVPTVSGYDPRPDRVTVLPADGTVRLVRGHLRPPPGQGVAMEYTPVARRFAAGETLTGAARIDLPLKPWHPYYHLTPYEGPLKQATLELGVLIGDPPEGVDAWDGRFAADTKGAEIRVPSLGYVVQRQKLVGSGPIPMP